MSNMSYNTQIYKKIYFRDAKTTHFGDIYFMPAKIIHWNNTTYKLYRKKKYK